MPNIIVKEMLSKPNEMSEKEFLAYMGMLLQLDGLLFNITKEFEEKLNTKGLYRFDIKKNITEIYKKLKNNPKCNWDNFSNDTIISFGDDGAVIEDIFKRLFGLRKGKTLCFVPQFGVDDKVWVEHNGKATLCRVLTIEIRVTYFIDTELDNSYYELEVLDGNNKPSGEYIQKGESEIYKHKKDLYENTTH